MLIHAKTITASCTSFLYFEKEIFTYIINFIEFSLLGWKSMNFRLLRFEEAHNDEKSAALVDDMILQPHILGQG